jgi:dynein heavy chain 1
LLLRWINASSSFTFVWFGIILFFTPIEKSNICITNIFFSLCFNISFLYEFSATTFMTIIGDVLEKNRGSGTEADRIASLKEALFKEVAARIARGLSSEDKIVFSTLLARLYTGDDSIGAGEVTSSVDFIAQFKVFGENYPWQGRGLNELLQVTEDELGPTVPLLLCSAPGHDVSGRVEAMARDVKKDLSSVAMGSTEGYEVAESLLTTASKRGNWVMLKNVHLCTDWLRETFVKKLQSLGHSPHADFRIFITSEINPKLPTGLLRLCDLIVAEAPTGICASMARFFSSISRSRMENPVRNRLYLLLAWTHAVIQERLRYIPSGWSEKYEFTEADASHALDVYVFCGYAWVMILRF